MDIVEILDRYAEGDEFQRPIETAIEEITKLREQVAAQASEIESLRISYDAACMLAAQMHEAVMGEVVGPQHGVVEDVRNKVAAQAAVIEKLREALIAGWSLQCDFDDARQLADDALAIPTDIYFSSMFG